MSASQTVNVAIIGGGLMGREIAAAIQRWPALIDHPVRPRLTAVCDIDPAALGWFEQIDTVALTTTDQRELLADPAIDVVYVAVRHDLHEQLYLDVLQAGKDLLAEKPFGIDAAAAARIAAAAERSGRFVRVSSEMPFFPGAQAAIDIVRSGSLGRIIEVESAFLHSSDYDPAKPINWKRQAAYCGEAGVMNDLGLHAWHVPLRLGWEPVRIHAVLQDLVPFRPGADGAPVRCDTIENATVIGEVEQEGGSFPLTVHTKRIAPGEKNTWRLRVVGMDGAVGFSTAEPKTLHLLRRPGTEGAPAGAEQSGQRLQVGSQAVWPTVTGAIFEAGFSDAILQMWAAFLAERAGALEGRFACASPAEALGAHRMAQAALVAHAERRLVEIAEVTR